MARIHMTRTVRIALYFLRIYLILLVGLILVKFILLFTGKSVPVPVQNPTIQSSGQ